MLSVLLKYSRLVPLLETPIGRALCRVVFGFMVYSFIFYKNLFYENIEAGICKILRLFLK